jgi:hypothetical protein
VEQAVASERSPKGWPAALNMFHIAMWRERMRTALIDLSEGRTPVQPGNADEINESELPSGIGTPLADAAARSDHLLREITDLYGRLGDRPFQWYRARTTSEAVLGNSYTHPRAHLHTYWRENGDVERANKLYEDAERELRAVGATEIPLGAILYNRACTRALDGKRDEALDLLAATARLRPDMKSGIATASNFVTLRDDARFQDLIRA